METLLIETLKQEVLSLRHELELVEQRAVALRSTIGELTERLAQAEEQQKQLAEYPAAVETTIQPTDTEEDNLPEIEVELIVADDDDEEDLEVEQIDSEATEPETEEETDEQEEMPELTDELPEATEETTGPVAEPLPEATEMAAQEEEGPAEEPTGAAKEPSHEPSVASASLLPPIDDIRKAITLGDRFLFQRELFAGDGEKMNKTIDALNKLDSLDEALQYIGKKFSWDKETPAFGLFYSILLRRFS